jgi:hypothetical protein
MPTANTDCTTAPHHSNPPTRLHTPQSRLTPHINNKTNDNHKREGNKGGSIREPACLGARPFIHNLQFNIHPKTVKKSTRTRAPARAREPRRARARPWHCRSTSAARVQLCSHCSFPHHGSDPFLLKNVEKIKKKKKKIEKKKKSGFFRHKKLTQKVFFFFFFFFFFFRFRYLFFSCVRVPKLGSESSGSTTATATATGTTDSSSYSSDTATTATTAGDTTTATVGDTASSSDYYDNNHKADRNFALEPPRAAASLTTAKMRGSGTATWVKKKSERSRRSFFCLGYSFLDFFFFFFFNV